MYFECIWLFTNMCVCVCPYLNLLFVWEANTTSVLAFDLIKNVINFQIVLITCSYSHTFTFRMSNHKKTCTTTNPSFAYILESNFCLYAIHTVNCSIHSYVFHWSALIWFHFTLRMWAAVCCCYASTGYRSFHNHTYTCRSRRLSIAVHMWKRSNLHIQPRAWIKLDLLRILFRIRFHIIIVDDNR